MAPRYPNGLVPQDVLITFDSGWLPDEGTWYHQLPPGTYAKHLTMVALAQRNRGRTLQISEGWGAYRPLHIQVFARERMGQWAAVPGTSSHGMFWEGVECAAIDYSNWGYVYDWDRGAFYADARAAGFEPGLISEGRGYPDEPWHVVDRRPWAAGMASGGGAVPFAPIIEEDEMKETYIWWINAAGDQQNLIYAIGGNGGQEFWTSSDGQYNTDVAKGHNLAGAAYKVSPGHAQNVLDMLSEQRAKS